MNHDELEEQLKRALAREEAPPWFEAKVMSAVARQKPRTWWQTQWRWAAATAMVAIAILGGIEWQHQATVQRLRAAQFEADQRQAGEAAKAQLQLALRVTSSKLVQIQQRLEAQSN